MRKKCDLCGRKRECIIDSDGERICLGCDKEMRMNRGYFDFYGPSLITMLNRTEPTSEDSLEIPYTLYL